MCGTEQAPVCFVYRLDCSLGLARTPCVAVNNLEHMNIEVISKYLTTLTPWTLINQSDAGLSAEVCSQRTLAVIDDCLLA